MIRRLLRSKVSVEKTYKCLSNDFSSYHIEIHDESYIDVDARQSNFESFHDINENIDDLSYLDEESF